MSKYIEKEIVVLDLMTDIESVIERYKRKGWHPISYVQVHEQNMPRSVKIKLKRLKPIAP